MEYEGNPWTLEVVQWVKVLSSIVIFLTGIRMCYEIYKAGNTKNQFVYFYAAVFLTCIFSLQFINLDSDLKAKGRALTQMIINGFGATIVFAYICFYLLFARERVILLTLMIIEIVIIDGMLYLTNNFPCQSYEPMMYLSCALGIANNASQLLQMYEVFSQRHVGNVKFMIVILMLIDSILLVINWTMVARYVMLVGAVIATVINIAMLSLYLFYPMEKDGPTGLDQIISGIDSLVYPSNESAEEAK